MCASRTRVFLHEEGILASRRDIDLAAAPTEQVRLGICALDRQHEALQQVLAEAVAAAEARDSAAARAAIGEFRELAIRHFAEEERLMEESRYPDRARHRAAHQLFLQDLAQVAEGLRDDALDGAALRLGLRVGEWMRFHVRVNDVPLAEHLARGVARSRAAPSKQPA